MSQFAVGLTGGIGSGKTTVTNIFSDLGIDIIDADVVARIIVEPNTPTLAKIVARFGQNILLGTGQLDRARLRTKVFSNDENLLWLNNLMHPIIRKTMTGMIAKSSSPYCILVAPLLIENNLQNLVDRVLVIDIAPEIQLERTLLRDSSSAEEIKQIIAKQLSQKARLSAADDILDNSESDPKHLLKLVKMLDQRYKKLFHTI